MGFGGNLVRFNNHRDLGLADSGLRGADIRKGGLNIK